MTKKGREREKVERKEKMDKKPGGKYSVFRHMGKNFGSAAEMTQHLAKSLRGPLEERTALRTQIADYQDCVAKEIPGGLEMKSGWLLPAKKPLPPKVFDGFDFESSKRRLNELDSVIDNARMVLRSAMGSSGLGEITLILNQSGDISSKVTSGIFDTVQSMDPSSSAEWASIAALFDEYHVVRGHYIFATALGSPQSTGAPNVPASSSNTTYVLAYDPNDSTVLTSVPVGCQLAQHKQFLFCGVLSNSGAANVNYSRGRSVPYKFAWRVPRGVFINGTTTAGNQWIPVGSPIAFGYMKSYGVGSDIVAEVSISGVQFFEVRFRSRS